MANEKLFKGIQLVKALPESPDAGVLYLVREHKDGGLTGNASVYFGSRKYGEVQSTKLDAIEAAIAGNAAAIEEIEKTLGEWEIKVGDEIATVASAVIAVSGATQTNASNIESLQESLAEGGATANAIAAAQAAANKAQGEVDTLEGVVAEKLAISDFETYSADTKTAYEQAASNAEKAAKEYASAYTENAITKLDLANTYDAKGAAATAEQNAKGYADGLNEAMDERVDALEAISGQSHTHVNKALLDTYTQTEADLEDAVAKKHSHDNKTELDKIAEGDKAKWDKATSDIDAFLKGEAISGSTVDTLKEIQNYITSDGQAAANMLSAIASAQTAADNAQAAADKAQGEVDTLEGVVAENKTELQGKINEKLAISDFNTYSAATKTAYEQVASAEADAAEAAAKAYVDAISADTRLEALEAISADTRLEALEDDTHTHSNKAVLDGISAEKVTAWDSAEQNAKTYANDIVDDLATGAVATNTTAIATLTGTGEGSVSKAVADAKTDLQDEIDKKLAISDFNTYSATTNSTLAEIQSALDAANAAAVKNVTAADASVVVTGDNADKKVAVKLSSIEGNMIALKEDGLYAAMYYGGDDVE